MENTIKNILNYLSRSLPRAYSEINGGEKYPNIKGEVEFYPYQDGVIVASYISGLPKTQTNIFAYHIHEGESCKDNFEQTGGHYNPSECEHPLHSGDMPPLFSNNGNAFSVFYTDRVNIDQILNKTVIVHLDPDDFVSQPSGNSGEKIACGEIKPVVRTSAFFFRRPNF